MRFRVDTHLHIYPFYTVAAALDALVDNMPAANGEVRVGCLTERQDCFLFDNLARQRVVEADEAYAARHESDTVIRLSRRRDGVELYLVAGQQIVTAENIEVLALNMAARVEDGRTAPETVDAVLAAGGLPVAAWGFGKWIGGRGRVVRDLLDRYRPGEIAIGDTTMRPHGWTTPFIMRAARRRGFHVLAGSDPLPFDGEERRAGSYHSLVDVPDVAPAEIVGRLLTLSPGAIGAGGSRGSPAVVAGRLLAHHRAAH